MKKKKTIEIEYFKLDISNAIMPNNWPSGLPKQLVLKTGEHSKEFDIVPEESWKGIFLEYVRTQNRANLSSEIPVGINKGFLPVGSFILNDKDEVIARGRDRKEYEMEMSKNKEEVETKLKELRVKYPNVKDKFLIDYDETVVSLISYIPLKNEKLAYNVFTDIFQSGGGSLYGNGEMAMLGAYNSLIDFNVLNATLGLFNKNDLMMIEKGFDSYKYLTPIHSVICGQIKQYLEPKLKKAMKG